MREDNTMKISNGAINCQACGAPVTSEICPYCGNATGLNTATANMEYPVLECKEANLTFTNLGIFIIFALPFLAVGIGTGYMDDNVLINDRPAQIVKLLVQTPEGPRFIMYQLGDTKRPYGVNSRIQLKVYRNYFMIDKDSNYINWG